MVQTWVWLMLLPQTQIGPAIAEVGRVQVWQVSRSFEELALLANVLHTAVERLVCHHLGSFPKVIHLQQHCACAAVHRQVFCELSMPSVYHCPDGSVQIPPVTTLGLGCYFQCTSLILVKREYILMTLYISSHSPGGSSVVAILNLNLKPSIIRTLFLYDRREKSLTSLSPVITKMNTKI